MTDIASALTLIRRVADRDGGARALSDAAGVPYTTVRSFVARRDHKNLSVLEKLEAAARKLEQDAAA